MGVEILIKLTALIFNRLLLLIVHGLIVLTLITPPVIVRNPISVAVNRPLVFDVKVLMVDPVAVEKNKFCATRLFATYIS